MMKNRGIRTGPLQQIIDQGRNPKYSEFVAKSFQLKQPKTGFKLPELPLVGNPWAEIMKDKK